MRNEKVTAVEYILLTLLAFVFIFPIFWMVKTSLSPATEVLSVVPKFIPSRLAWENYIVPFERIHLLREYANTIIIVGLSMIGIVFVAPMCAYSFARLEWVGRDTVFMILLTGIILPPAVTLIPSFIGWSNVGLSHSYAPLIVPNIMGGGVFDIFLLRQYFKSLPKELGESARIDGAGYLQEYFLVYLPLAKSGVIVVGLFGFFYLWNDYLNPLVYINKEANYTLALGLREFIGSYTAQWNYLMAAATLIALPCIVLYAVGQKYIVEGISTSGLKG